MAQERITIENHGERWHAEIQTFVADIGARRGEVTLPGGASRSDVLAAVAAKLEEIDPQSSGDAERPAELQEPPKDAV
jgi:hypothetical protein